MKPIRDTMVFFIKYLFHSPTSQVSELFCEQKKKMYLITHACDVSLNLIFKRVHVRVEIIKKKKKVVGVTFTSQTPNSVDIYHDSNRISPTVPSKLF